MNIGLLVYDISLTGGAEAAALNLAEEFGREHDTCLISLFSERGQSCYLAVGFEAVYLRQTTVSITAHFVELSRELREVIESRSLDVVFAISAGVVTVALFASCGTAAKIVYCEHSNLENKTYGKKHELRQMIGAKYSDIVVTLTERDRANFVHTFKLPEERVVAIPNWFVATEGEPPQYDVASKAIVSVGRLEMVKGYDYLLEVAYILKEICDGWSWDIFGDGSYRERIQSRIEMLGLNEHVRLKGNVSDLPVRLPKYSMFVMTSLFEGLPMSLLEAQEAGLPIVSFDIATGPAEIVSDGENGALIEPYDTVAMACEVARLQNDDALRSGYAAKARMNLGRYSKKAVLAKWSNLLRNISVSEGDDAKNV